MATRIEQIYALGQSVWCDSISRSLIDSGQLQKFIDDGIVGMTSNPSIFHQAISKSDDYNAAIETLVSQGKDADAIYERRTGSRVGHRGGHQGILISSLFIPRTATIGQAAATTDSVVAAVS